MFRIRPTHIVFDPWTCEYVGVPEELVYAGYRPYEGLHPPQAYDCQDCAVGPFDAYSRPGFRGHRHPFAAGHAPQQHPGFKHPQAARWLYPAHPAAGACRRAQAAPSYPPYDDDQDSMVDTTEAEQGVVIQGAPSYAEPRSCPLSSHALLRGGSSRPPTSEVGPESGQQPEPVYETGYCRKLSPFFTAQQQQAVQQQQQQQHHHHQPASPATSAASNRFRHSIPVTTADQDGAGCFPAVERVTVHHGATAATPPALQQQQQQAHPVRKLTRGEAAIVIQSWWRMRRLARQKSALKALATAAAQLRHTSSLFQSYKEEPSAAAGHQQQALSQGLSHRQYLELNELAMRVLLQLDATSCGVAELRAVRKRLTAAAIKLLDEIQASYSAAVNASMELPDVVVQAALQGMAADKPAAAPTAPTAPCAAAAASAVAEQQHHEAEMAVHDGGKSRKAAPATDGSNEQHLPVTGDTQESMPAAQTAAAEHEHEHEQPPVEEQGQQQVEYAPETPSLPAGVRVVLVYPGNRAEAATQTEW